MFGKNKTIEFRVHTPTMNPYKIANWVLITSAIVKYAIYIDSLGSSYNLNNIKTIKLKDVIDHVYSSNHRLANYLKTYISFRKDNRGKSDELGDFIGYDEIKNDHQYNVDFY